MEKPQKLPSGRYRARVFRDGKKVSLGTFATYKEAEAEIARAIVSPEDTRRGQMKFWKYAETHLAVEKDRWARGTWENNVRNYNKHLVPTFGQKKLADISPALVKRWWVGMADRPGPRRAAYMVLSGIMHAAEADGEITRWVGIKGSSKDVSTPRPIALAQDVQILKMLATDSLVSVVLTVLLASGLRIGEILALDWQDFDAKEGTLHVYKHLTRHGMEPGRKKHPEADILQPIPDATVAALEAYKAQGEGRGPIFLNSHGERLSYHAWWNRWDALRNQWGMDSLHTHDIRSIHLTLFAEKATLKETMERGGHSDYRSAMRYQRPDPQRQKEIVTQMVF